LERPGGRSIRIPLGFARGALCFSRGVDSKVGTALSKPAFIPVLTLAMATTAVGCGRPAAWPHSGVVIVSRAPPPAHRGTCTGAVVSSTPSGTLVLTARHCVVDDDGAAKAAEFEVTYPAAGPGGDVWRTVPAWVVRTGQTTPGSWEPEPETADGWTWLHEDWAVLRVDTSDPIESIPVLEGDPARIIHAGEPVELVSCFDTDEPRPRCHTHTFGFGDKPRELIEGGHSGAPILWRGRIIATFTGGHADWFLFFRRFWWLRSLTVGDLAKPRAALADVAARPAER
jgi:hypothetical protein